MKNRWLRHIEFLKEEGWMIQTECRREMGDLL